MIRELKTKDFKVTQNEIQIRGVRGPGMILVHQKWCGHCVRFLPVYADLDTRVGHSFPLVSVEGDAIDPALMRKLVDQGFPTIKFFDKNGFITKYSYNGERDINSLLRYICDNFHTCNK